MTHALKAVSVADGMTRAQAMLERRGHAPMEDTLGFALLEIGEGRAVFAGTPGPNVLNPMGIAHGGYAATLLDSTCGIAVLTTLAEGQKVSTLELKVAYHKAVDVQTGPVRGAADCLCRGATNRCKRAPARIGDLHPYHSIKMNALPNVWRIKVISEI